jgi:hypothetical protein
VLKNALIGLAIIALAWMIVSVVFWFISVISSGNQTESSAIEKVPSDGGSTIKPIRK